MECISEAGAGPISAMVCTTSLHCAKRLSHWLRTWSCDGFSHFLPFTLLSSPAVPSLSCKSSSSHCHSNAEHFMVSGSQWKREQPSSVLPTYDSITEAQALLEENIGTSSRSTVPQTEWWQQARSPSAHSLTDITLDEGVENQSVHTPRDQARDHILVPRLEELELYQITFSLGVHCNTSSLAITRHCLFSALSTRNTPSGRLIMTQCNRHGFQENLKEVVWP
jgi:hypothetical protein